MTKKLIALVEVLMVLSLFCTGFASWTIMSPNATSSWNQNIEDSTAHNVTKMKFNPAYFGISLTDRVNGVAECDTFRYSTVTQAGSSPVNAFSNTTLSVLIQIDQTKLEQRMADGDYRENAVLINCVTKNGSTVYPIAANSGTSYSWEQNKLVYSQTCKLTLRGYPNLYFYGTVAARTSDGSLDVVIPIEQLYNLAVLDKVSSSSSSKPPIYVKLELDFTDTGYTNANIPNPCNFSPVFTVQTKDKT